MKTIIFFNDRDGFKRKKEKVKKTITITISLSHPLVFENYDLTVN
jgi:hypothetical protein